MITISTPFTLYGFTKYPNSIKILFIPYEQIGTFFTAGSDGAILFWDKDHKQKLKTLGKCPLPIVDADFNKDCSHIAYGISYDWSKVNNYLGGKNAHFNFALIS